MEELKSLILQKISFIHYFQEKSLIQQSSSADSQLLHLLILEKKKMHLNQSLQAKIINALLGKTIQAPYRLLQFYQQSKFIMKAYDLISKTIQLYQKFFNAQNNSLKAQQIYHLYKKKLCPNGLLLPTIFCWLLEWIKKQFSIFLKEKIKLMTSESKNHCQNNLSSYKKEKRQLKQEKKQLPKIGKQIQIQSGLLKPQSSKQQLYKNIQLLKSRQKRSNKFKQKLNLPIFSTVQVQKDINEHSKHQSFLLKKKYSQKNILISEDNQIQQFEEKLAINRQIVIGAYYDRFLNYYRGLQSSIPDIDFQFIRQVKRNDRKSQIKQKIRQITRSFALNQTSIKNSIEKYVFQYKTRKQLLKQKRIRKKKIQLGLGPDKQIDQKRVITNISNDQKNQQNRRNQQLQSLKSLQLESNLLKNQTAESRRKLKKQINIEAKKQFNKPFQMSLNLPKIPEINKSSSAIKGKSKAVLINSGRYKIDVNQLKKRKLTSRSIDLGYLKQSQKKQIHLEFQQIKIQNKQKPIKLNFKQEIKLIDKLFKTKQNPQKQTDQSNIQKYEKQLIRKIKRKKNKFNVKTIQMCQNNISTIQQNKEYQTIDYKIQGWSQSY